jgi:cyclophilin family peptidyl-prolyl cis-trans isomerase
MTRAARFFFFVLVLLFCAGSSGAAPADPRVAPDRIVLRTNVGDMVLALYPDAAPKTVSQMQKLAKLGVFDGVHVARVEPGYLIQLGRSVDRDVPLSSEQTAAIAKLPLEVSELRHTKGVLSMAHGDDPNDAEFSFFILLGDAPHLDGKFAVFGRVESGFDVAEEMARVSTDAAHRPNTPLTINHALVTDAAALGSLGLHGAVPQAHEQPSPTSASGDPSEPVSPGRTLIFLAILGGLGFSTFWFAGKLSQRAIASLGLLSVLVAFFFAFTILSPIAPTTKWLAVAMFVGTISIFKLVNRFESPR